MAFRISELWDWRGTVDRGKYVAVGLLLFALKHNIDRFVATFGFHRSWSLFNYWIPEEAGSINDIPVDRLWFYAVLLAIAIPFMSRSAPQKPLLKKCSADRALCESSRV